MAKLLKLRRGTTTQHGSFTGAEGEVTVDTDKETLVVHDGSTAGGHPVAAEDMANVSSASIAGRLATDSIAPAKIAAGTLPTDVTVASANIVDGTIVTADLANSAVNSDKLDNSAVTFAKIQNVGQNTLAGRTASGSGPATDLSASSARTLLNVEDGATADQTAAEILTAIKTVDGGGSGLDADTLDGVQGASFLRSDANDTMSGELTFTTSGSYPIDINGSSSGKIVLRGSNDPYITFRESNTDKAYLQWHSGGYLKFKNHEDASSLRIKDTIDFSTDDSTWHTVWHAGNDGAGSGLDADELDGIAGSGYLRSNTADQADGVVTFAGGSGAVTIAANSDIRLSNGSWTGESAGKIQHNSNWLYIQGGTSGIHLRSSGGTNRWTMDSSGHLLPSADSTYNIGSNGTRVANGYFDTLHGDGSNLTGVQPFPSGTKMLFQQTSAPTGWTKVTSSVDNKALRVVSGSVSSGGNQAFTSAFASRTPAGNVGSSGNSTASFSGSVSGNTGNSGASTSNVNTGGNVNNHTLSSNQMPSHSHSIFSYYGDQYDNRQGNDWGQGMANNGQNVNTNNTGGGGSHSHGFSGSGHSHNVNNHTHSFSGNFSGNTGNHTHNAGSFSGSAMDFAVQYLDVIICSKD